MVKNKISEKQLKKSGKQGKVEVSKLIFFNKIIVNIKNN